MTLPLKKYGIYFKKGDQIEVACAGILPIGANIHEPGNQLNFRLMNAWGHNQFGYIAEEHVSAVVPGTQNNDHPGFRIVLKNHQKAPIIVHARRWEKTEPDGIIFYKADNQLSEIPVKEVYIVFSEILSIIPVEGFEKDPS